jgi:D-alanyl-lipoteichoic acid acyltransferase DltB (MBOAT superfamily)
MYALLIFFSTVVTYFCADQIHSSKSKKSKKAWVTLSVVSNFSILFLFKYYNFITHSIIDLMTTLGLRVEFPEFKLLLPVGISFYTFQAVGYSIDVYWKKIAPEKHLGKYALFVSFFPQLVAGPIERASNLLPQFHKKIHFDYHKAIEGTKLIIWGFFMKVAVANRLAIYVDAVYNNAEMHSSPSLIMATFFFMVQIYCDFAGYSNIAIGCAKILGFDLMINFRRPYFAKSISEFWQRWHISLSNWFKDYVYIPLVDKPGGASNGRKVFSLMTTFLVNGLWHGANWTFVVWGLMNGVYQMFDSVFKFNLLKINSFKAREAFHMLRILILFGFTVIFFRANSISDAFLIIKNMFVKSGPLFIDTAATFFYCWFCTSIIFVRDLYDEYHFHKKLKLKRNHKYIWYISLTLLILLIGVFDSRQFIYFQF